MGDVPGTTESGTRRAARGLPLEIVIDRGSEHNFWANLACEVAQGGVFVATYQTLELGRLVELYVSLPDGAEPMVVSGIVRWTRPHLEGSDGCAGVGIKFVNLSPVMQARVERFIQVREPMVFELDETPMRGRRTAA